MLLVATLTLCGCGSSAPATRTAQSAIGGSQQTLTTAPPIAVVSDHSLRGAILADERWMIAATQPYWSWMPGYRLVAASRNSVRFENLYLTVNGGLQYWATLYTMAVWQQGRWVARGEPGSTAIGASLVNTAIRAYARFPG